VFADLECDVAFERREYGSNAEGLLLPNQQEGPLVEVIDLAGTMERMTGIEPTHAIQDTNKQ
jgi:hypothetical protein